jgi:hypothetical protein
VREVQLNCAKDLRGPGQSIVFTVDVHKRLADFLTDPTSVKRMIQLDTVKAAYVANFTQFSET